MNITATKQADGTINLLLHAVAEGAELGAAATGHPELAKAIDVLTRYGFQWLDGYQAGATVVITPETIDALLVTKEIRPTKAE